MTPRSTTRPLRLAAAVIVGTLAIAACGGADDADDDADVYDIDLFDAPDETIDRLHDDGRDVIEQIPDLVDVFDFAVNEQCVKYDECDVYAPFVRAGKPVFGAEYSDDAVSDPERACSTAADAGISALILPVELDGSFRIAC